MAADSGRFDGAVALGCVIRGETSHYDYVCGESARGLMDLIVQRRQAIGYGILTVENEEQALVRADRKRGNKGKDAAEASPGDDQIPQGTYSVTDQKIPFEVTRARRAGARLAAVQALYEMEQTGKSARATIRAFMEDRLGIGPNEEPIEEADPDIFKSIVNAVVEHQAAIDKAILARLASGWKLTRLDATMRALLRAGAAEFIQHQHLSNAIILDEYVSLAHDFFEEQEAKFANAVLDNLAKDLRA